MDNIQTYLHWRKDLTFNESAFNEVDALIFAALAYVEWEDVVKEELPLPIACKKFSENLKEEDKRRYFFAYELPSMVEDMINTKRYKEVTIKNYSSILDKVEEVQFAAVTFILPDKTEIVAYRGTDSNIVGWKEDFNMTFQKEVPAQKYALAYLKENCIPPKNKKLFSLKTPINPDLYIVGHSKGGNLAMYAAIKAKNHHKRIKRVYNFDGPGFNESFYEENDAISILPKIINILPECSIFGRLLTHKEKTKIIKGYNAGLLQHSPYRWKVECNHFVESANFDKSSDEYQEYLEKALLSKSDEGKKKIITAVFEAIGKLNIDLLSDIGEVNPKDLLESIKEFSLMNAEERKFVIDCLKFFITQTRDLIKIRKQ